MTDVSRALPVEGEPTGRGLLGGRASRITFVGGTGRSGTHVLAKLIARHPRLDVIPVEARFHVEDRGFPGLLAGTVSKRDFLRRLRGFWWRGFQTRRMRGLYRFVPRDRFEEAVSHFDASFDADPEAACRGLFLDLLLVRVGEDSAGLVEQSCDTVAAAPILVKLFPEARFIHVVRDGRDASASRVAQTRWLIRPRTRRQGLEWWEERIRRIDAGARAVPPDRLLTVSLDELLLTAHSPSLRPLCSFLGVYVKPRMLRFFQMRMSAEQAHAERWRRGLSARRAAEFERFYEEALDRLEADGVRCVPMLRRTLERSRAPGADSPPALAYMSGDGARAEMSAEGRKTTEYRTEFGPRRGTS